MYCLFLVGGVRAPAELFPPAKWVMKETISKGCETFVVPLWVSKCPGGSKCQRHTRRLRWGENPQCALCHAEINGIWDVSRILWNYDELSESIRESIPIYLRWWDLMILPEMEIIKAYGRVFRIMSPKVCPSDIRYVFPSFPVISCTWLGVYNQMLIHCSGSAELRTCNVNIKKSYFESLFPDIFNSSPSWTSNETTWNQLVCTKKTWASLLKSNKGWISWLLPMGSSAWLAHNEGCFRHGAHCKTPVAWCTRHGNHREKKTRENTENDEKIIGETWMPKSKEGTRGMLQFYECIKLSHRCSNLAHSLRLRFHCEPPKLFESHFPSETCWSDVHVCPSNIPCTEELKKKELNMEINKRQQKQKSLATIERMLQGADVSVTCSTFLPSKCMASLIFQILQTRLQLLPKAPTEKGQFCPCHASNHGPNGRAEAGRRFCSKLPSFAASGLSG